MSGEGHESALDVDAGVEFNFGPATDLQLTAAFPLSFSHTAREGWEGKTGDVELGVKYRFFTDERTGVSAAIFPKTIIPTSSVSGDDRPKFQLPLWLGKDFAHGTSVFGGGAFEINTGPGNENFWLVAIAMTHPVSRKWSIGAEITEQGVDTVGGTVQTRAGVGSTIRISNHYGLLFSGGPTWADHRTGYHLYGALGLFF